MQNDENKAINAIWMTELKDANEKLVLYQLATKHDLGERYSSSWKSLEQFISDFETKWCSFKEIIDGTRLSHVKAERTLNALKSRNLVESKEIPVKLKKNDVQEEYQTVYGITAKIFIDFQDSKLAGKVASA
ncbi:hypothetical protein [Pseudobacteriovorax antillogorgiicola]|uniref:Winged helix DNA-binding domain-containing protein n=1 Tax=Pseudobacteriovorax antillogorgiicola TaxID=1513793 RepID=A0A1Y6B711_9BACT|nr:hypothetical protein [Pseudobacteriovorax antillogorgiicola]TCS58675.1 hypothetical protein EDD56_102188 [Pseudobacteriovorax antillogorgiicola]SME96031.1 hypothetical protein SAMN06296036_102255 [Pseudobacteriovorax antillogorgiicola]